MNESTMMLPPLTREANFTLLDQENERTIEVVWTTGAVVQRRRWDGISIVEYDEELVVEPGAVRLERMQSGIPFLDTHQGLSVSSVLGSVVPGSVRLENGHGYARVRLTDAPDAESAIRRVLEKHVSISVGYRVYQYKIVKRENERELWRAVDWEPIEISAVPMPADPGARIRSENDDLNSCVLIRADVTADPADAERRVEMTEEVAGSAVEPDVDAVRNEVRQNAAEILRICERHGLPNSFAAELIGAGMSLDQARAAILDRLAEEDMVGARKVEPVPTQINSSDAAYRDAVTEALLHRHSPKDFNLTDRARDFMGMSLIELARHALERRGVSTRGMSKMELASEALFSRAGLHSTSDFPYILANVANTVLRQAYEGTPRTFTAWARQRTIVDFKPVSVTQLAGAPSLLKVPESGEFQYGTIGESREIYALVTYGRIVGITRQVLINDDLDAFTRLPAAYGAAAADLESDIVYSILIDNPIMSDGQPLFSSVHGNVGTAAAINETSLAQAYRMFGEQHGLDGRKITVLPRFLITPPGARSVEARKNIANTVPSDVAGVNPFAGRLEPVEEPRLIPSSGTDPWFLAADPTRIDTVEYAYLQGQQGVYTEVRVGFEVDGVEIKARHDFAAKAIDWRGLFYNAGA